ncbi:MAG: TolC family protein [Sedimentisphaerales bacterium]
MANYNHNTFKYRQLSTKAGLLYLFLAAFTLQIGCNSPQKFRKNLNKTADNIIREKQIQAVGKTSKFSIERPSDILRRRLLLDQNLPVSSRASFGSDRLEKIEHWPEKNFPDANTSQTDSNNVSGTITISLLDALQIGAKNSPEYQSQKEDVFSSALDLELERRAFRNTFIAQIQNLTSTDTTGNRTVSGNVAGGNVGVSRKFSSGAEISNAIAIDLANLLNMGGASSTGIAGEGSISIPLLRGSGKHIVMEDLTQAERNTVYAIWNFETYKKQFAVDAASKYLSVLRQLDSIKNSEADYKSRMVSSRWSRRLATAGRLKEIEVDQAVQNELSSRQQWISAVQTYKKQLDAFKMFIGLPPDANIVLNPAELETLTSPTKVIINEIAAETNQPADTQSYSLDVALIELLEPDYKNAGPLEITEAKAIQLAFDNRLDLKGTDGKVYDAQRAVVVAADALGAELTFLGSAKIGSRRNTVGSATSENSRFVANRGVYSSLLTLDLGLERTAESVAYRKSYIELEKAVRDVQILEDGIKTQIRNTLRDLLEARENMYIQAKAVYVAQKRVRSVTMFLNAGRTEIRNLLEAQDALLSAQNQLTAAVVNYRIAELTMQQHMGVLQIDEDGLWQEYLPGGNLKNVED